jgi:MFS family permease
MPRQSEAAPPQGAPESVFSAPYRTLTCGVVLSVALVAFESLGVATVLPLIAHDLHGLGLYGWGLSALMLANIVGTVVAGRTADRSGPRRPMALGLLVFTAGCALAGAAGSWPLFLLGRFGQGLGVGAVLGMAYTVIGLAYPERLRARMFALLSSAWTVPSLVGPTLAARIAEGADWRGVFWLMLPLTALAASLTLPALPALCGRGRAAGRPDPGPDVPWWRGPVTASVALTAGTALLLAALELTSPIALVLLALLGLTVATVTLRQVAPAGTLSARRGVGAGIAIRGLLCAVYFGSEAFLPLGLTESRGLSATQAGLGLSAGALTWVAGSVLQARRDGRADKGAGGRTGGVALGFAVLLAGLALMALGVLSDAVPALTSVLGWAVAGLGMGVAFNAATTDTMEQAPAGREGEVSAGLQLAQTLATAVISGVGGAVIAAAQDHGGTTRTALLTTFALTGALAALGIPLSRRLRPAP